MKHTLLTFAVALCCGFAGSAGAAMNKDELRAKAEQLKGKVKEAFGSLTGDRKKEAEGEFDQAKGTAREKYGEAKEAASEKYDETKEAAGEKVEDIKRGLSSDERRYPSSVEPDPDEGEHDE